MNEFCAKKLGEVLAFENLGKQTFVKGKVALTKIFPSEVFDDICSIYEGFISQIEQIAKNSNVSSITFPKKDKTLAKLGQMQDLYVGDEWDNPVELCEWSGFYEGAAIVHWELVLGAAYNLKDEKLEHLALKAIRFHSDSLRIFSDKLRENGIKKSALN